MEHLPTLTAYVVGDGGRLVSTCQMTQEQIDARQDVVTLPIGREPDGLRPRWDGTTWVFEPDGLSLDDMRGMAWQATKVERARREFGGLVWQGHVFDSDPDSQQRIRAAAEQARAYSGFSVAWTLADNSSVTLSRDDMIEVAVALAEHVAAVHAWGRGMRESIAGMGIEALETLTFS